MRKNRFKLRNLLVLLILASLSMYFYSFHPTSIKLREKFQLSGNCSPNQMENDFETLIDLKCFKFKLNPPQCSQLREKPKVVAFIVSAAGNFESRQTIRQSWGNAVGKMLVLFLLGGVERVEDQRRIEDEFKVISVKLTLTYFFMLELCRFMVT
jgi:hypothetical protein